MNMLLDMRVDTFYVAGEFGIKAETHAFKVKSVIDCPTLAQLAEAALPCPSSKIHYAGTGQHNAEPYKLN